MSWTNRRSGLTLSTEVFGALHKALIVELKEHYQVSPETLVDYQLYGFNYYDENLPSIKKLILDKTGSWVNGKYLYNKYREWKNGADPIRLTREFVFVYFKALGFRDVRDFMINSSLSEAAISEQINLEKPIVSLLQNEYYVGYYIGEEGDIIATRLILSENNLKVRWALAYWEKEHEYSEYIYDGIIQYQQNGMSFIFRNEDTKLDRSLFISIFCERQVKVKPFLVGAYAGYDRNRQPALGEVIFQRVTSEEEQIEMLKSKKVSPVIAQHIAGRRWVVNGRNPQTLLDISPESKFAHSIEGFIQSFKGICAAMGNGVFAIEMSIEDSLGNASLSIAGHPLYNGTFKVQASGQLLIGRFANAATKAPLFMSIEVLPIREHLYTGNLLGTSRFVKSFSGKVYLSSHAEISEQIPAYRGSELTSEEIRKLPDAILTDLTDSFRNKQLEKYLEKKHASLNNSNYLHHLTGAYTITYYDKSKREKTARLNIEENGESVLTAQHLIYEGNAMMCEGGILSVYFAHCNGIPHCGQIVGRVGRKARNEFIQVEANWFCLNENYLPEILKIRVTQLTP